MINGLLKVTTEHKKSNVRRSGGIMSTLNTPNTLKALSLLQREVLESWDFNRTFHQVLNLLLEITQSQIGFIAETTVDTENCSCLRIHAISNVAWHSESQKLFEQLQNGGFLLNAPDSLIDAVIHTQQPVISNDPKWDERSKGVPDGHPPLSSFLGLPLIKNGKVIGVVGLANRPQGYDEGIIAPMDIVLTVCTTLIYSHLQLMARQESEDTLLASEERYRRLFETISQGVIYRSANGSIIAANPAAERIFGLTQDQLRKVAASDYSHQVIREDGSAVSFSELPTIEALRTGHAVGPIVLGIIDPQSTKTKWLSVRAIPLFRPMDKGPFQAYAVVEDITREKQAEDSLRQSERLYRLAQTASGVGIWDWDLVNDQLLWDSYCWAMLGETPQDQLLCYADWQKRVHPDDINATEQDIYRQLALNESFSVEFRLRTANNDWIWINGRGRIVETDADGNKTRIMGTHTNIHHRKLIELNALEKQAMLERANSKLRLLSTVFTHAAEGVIITTPAGIILDANDAFCQICGYDRDEVVGRNPRMFQSGEQKDSFYREMWQSLRSHGHWTGELWNFRKDGLKYCQSITISAVSDDTGITQYYVALISDITAAKDHRQQLEYMAHYDLLTGLPNRKLLADRLQQAIAYAKRHKQILGVAYIDLDGFKEINDNHGHDAGDHLLKTVADRMRLCLRDSDTIARFGGDEFVAVIIEMAEPADAMTSIHRLLEVIDRPVYLDNIQLQVTASIGVAYWSPSANIESDLLVRHADQAMYQAKLTGKNRYHVFDAAHDSSMRDHHAMLERIDAALDADELVLYYQPKVNMRTGAILGVEGLIRWNHPENGLLAPGAFLPVLENHPLGIKLGEWVIDKALQQMQNWQQQNIKLPTSINIAACHLQQTDFVERLRCLLSRYPDVSSGCLSLEVLETSALDDIEQISVTISQCIDMDVAVALDDFGTGYSSLDYLRRLPAQILKIDQTFVRGMLSDIDDLSILEGIMGLAAAFRHQTIAEGVETVTHGELLLDLGCDLAQGYGIGYPMPAAELKTWVDRWQPYPSWLHRPYFQKDKIPFLSAAVYHRAWVAGVAACLIDEGEIPTLEHDACRFSAWIHHEGKELYYNHEDFLEIEQLHLKIHELGQALVDMKQQGRTERALQGLDNLYFLRDRLLELLQRLATYEKDDVA